MNFLLKTSLAMALSASVACPANAALITHHQDNSALRGALSDIQVEDFEDLTLLDGLSIGGRGNIATGMLYRLVLPSTAATFSFAESIFGFGGAIRSGGFGSLVFTLIFEDGSTQILDPFDVGPDKLRYLGISSDVGIREISVKPAGAGTVQFYMEDLTYGTALAAVPEPASWAMMIIGLGVVGTAMRRQHVRRVSFA